MPRVAMACRDGFPSYSTAGRRPHPRIPYRLYHFAVDAISSWAGLPYPGLSGEWVAMASKENSLAAAAHAMEHAACEVGEVEGAAFALVALYGAELAVAHHLEAAAAGHTGLWGMSASRISPTYSSCRGPLAGGSPRKRASGCSGHIGFAVCGAEVFRRSMPTGPCEG